MTNAITIGVKKGVYWWGKVMSSKAFFIIGCAVQVDILANF